MGKPRASKKVAVRTATPAKAVDKLTDLVKEIISNLLEGKAPTEKRLTKLLGEIASGTFCLIPITSRTITKTVTRFRDRIIKDIIPSVTVTAVSPPPSIPLIAIDCFIRIGYVTFPGKPAGTIYFNGKMMLPQDSRNRKVQDLVNLWPGDKWVDGDIPPILAGPTSAGGAITQYKVNPPAGYICKRITPQPYIPSARSQVQTGLPPVILTPPPPRPIAPPPGFVETIVPGAGGTQIPGGRIPITRGLGQTEFAQGYTPPERRRK